MLTTAVALPWSANALAPPAPVAATTSLVHSPVPAAGSGWKPLGRPSVRSGARRAKGPAVTTGHTPQHNVSISVRVMPVPIDPEGQPTTYAFAVAQNFPNPFAGGTTIRYTMAQTAKCELTVFSVTGQRVATLVSEVLRPGEYAVRWNGRSDRGERLRAGLYLYRLSAGSATRSRKLIVR